MWSALSSYVWGAESCSKTRVARLVYPDDSYEEIHLARDDETRQICAALRLDPQRVARLEHEDMVAWYDASNYTRAEYNARASALLDTEIYGACVLIKEK